MPNTGPLASTPEGILLFVRGWTGGRMRYEDNKCCLDDLLEGIAWSGVK